MLLSFKPMHSSPSKTESEDESGTGTTLDESKVPRISEEDFDFCAGCRLPFRGIVPVVNNGPSAEGTGTGEDNDGTNGLDITDESGDGGSRSRRGQQETIEAKKIKEFYSFSVVSGELLRVTALQALLSVYDLRVLKSAPGLNLEEANQNLAFCQNCACHISQLYKLKQEVTGLLHKGSVTSRLMDYEEVLTDTQEIDFSNPKKRRKIASSRGNVSSFMETQDNTWNGDDNGNDDADDHQDPSWNNDDYDMGNDDSYENGEADEVNVKPARKVGGLKITSVAGTVVDDFDSDAGEGTRGRRRSAKPVNYRKVLQGSDDEEEEWQEPSRKGGRSTPAKKKAPAPKKSPRGRPTKSSKVVVPPPKTKAKDQTFKSPADKSSRETACNICKKLFPANYLAEHMNVAHNAVAGQPCLICGKVFENSYKAIKHLLTHVPEKAFGCSRCHETFSSAEERNLHTSSHLDSDQPLECPKCPNSFNSLLLLNKHEAQKHRQTKSFLCSICAKLLTGKDEWIQHILSHGPFQCYYCKIFLKPGEYKRHVQTVHITRPKLTPSATGPIAEVDLIDSD